MDSNERLRRGLSAVAQTGLDWAQRQYQIEAKNQYETASTQIAGEVDRFNMDLDNDPDYQSYGEKWAKKQQDLMKYVGTVKNPEAKREIELFMQRTMESQETMLQGKTVRGLQETTYISRSSALQTRLDQAGIPTDVKIQDIERTVDSLVQDAGMDRLKAYDQKISLASAVIGNDLQKQALSVFQKAAELGPEVALGVAENLILDYKSQYQIGGQAIGVSETQKNYAQNAVRDAYNISERAARAAEEKLYKEEDTRMYNGYSTLVAGDKSGLTYSAIDQAKLPNDRKMYWRSQIEQSQNLKERGKDAMLEASVTGKYLMASKIVQELKRAGGALSGDITVRSGDSELTLRDLKGLEDFLNKNEAEFVMVFGKQWATMREDLIKGIDQQTGVSDGIKSRLAEYAKANKMPDWELAEYTMMYDARLKELGGKDSLEEADKWFATTVMRKQLKRKVQQIGYGALVADNDDIITRMIWNIDGQGPNEFRYDVHDGRFVNPRTKSSLDSYVAASSREYEKATGLKPGEYRQVIQNTASAGAVPYFVNETGEGTESTTRVPFGSGKESMLMKTTIKDEKIISTLVFDPKKKKWLPAQRRLDNAKVWDWAPETIEARKNETEILRLEKMGKRGESETVIGGTTFYSNKALEGGL